MNGTVDPRRIFRGLAAAVAAALIVPVLPTPASGQQPLGNCVDCHRDLAVERLAEPARTHELDVHGAAELSCAGCHGGDAAADDESVAHQGMLASPPRSRATEICGRCHSEPAIIQQFDPNLRVDQVDRYWTSVHGRRLREEGDTLVATCIDCHTPHAILPASEERSSVHPKNIPDLCGSCHADPEHMAPYPIAVDQLDEYRQSVHWLAVTEGGDLSAPVCNDCHGNHGAVPPGYTSVGRVCSECHARIGDYFAASPHDTAFVRLERPGCATCHGNHAIGRAGDEMLGVGPRGTCGGSGCHTRNDTGGAAAVRMSALIDSLEAGFEEADSVLHAAERAGMPVSQAQFELNQARNALVGARAASHTVSVDSVRVRVEEGDSIAGAGIARGHEAFADLAFRRKGLAVSSAVIVLLIVALLFKIRQVETERR